MELIKDRLAHIIRAKNLTATQFAEMMQIQPSNVSHLLSGRNKPSLDFLIKLKDVFPEYNFDWIILGKKPITISEPHLIVKDDYIKSEDFLQVQEHKYDCKDTPIDIKHELENDKSNYQDEKDNQCYMKTIKHIIYMYEDHTFEIFTPTK